jgi:hypothetical protein
MRATVAPTTLPLLSFVIGPGGQDDILWSPEASLAVTIFRR